MRKRFTAREILEGKLLKPLPPRCLFIWWKSYENVVTSVDIPVMNPEDQKYKCGHEHRTRQRARRSLQYQQVARPAQSHLELTRHTTEVPSPPSSPAACSCLSFGSACSTVSFFLLTSSNTPCRHNRWLHHRYLILIDFYDCPLQI